MPITHLVDEFERFIRGIISDVFGFWDPSDYPTRKKSQARKPLKIAEIRDMEFEIPEKSHPKATSALTSLPNSVLKSISDCNIRSLWLYEQLGSMNIGLNIQPINCYAYA